MSETHTRHPLALKRVVYRREGMEAVPTLRDVEYHQSEAGTLALDIYHPHPPASGPAVPVVLFVMGLPDVGVSSPLGFVFKDVEGFISMAQLVAASGMAAVTYTTSLPATDIEHVLDYLDHNSSALNIDTGRLGLWAMSAHVPVALLTLMRQPQKFRAAVLSNGYTLDLEGTAVTDVFRNFGLANPCEGRTVQDLPPDVPLFIARSGQDEFPGLNQALDRFVAAAIGRNLPVMFANHPTAPHAFEVNDDSERSRCILGQMLAFMQCHLA